MIKKTGLGRGLESLLGEVQRDVSTQVSIQPPSASPDSQADAIGPAGNIRMVAIGEIRPHPDQPRRHFAESALNELAESIAQRGVIQPIVIRPLGKGFQIIAGERRWRAAQRARLHEIPAIVRDFSDGEALEIALIENIQREDLNPMEEAEAYQKLMQEFGHTQAVLAKLVDKSRSHVANLMRLLELPKSVREMVVDTRLSMGHARALVTQDNAQKLADRVISEGLSVRELEALIKKARHDDKPAAQKSAAEKRGNDGDIKALETQLSEMLGVKVAIRQEDNGAKGQLSLHYQSLDQLDMLCQRLSGEEF